MGLGELAFCQLPRLRSRAQRGVDVLAVGRAVRQLGVPGIMKRGQRIEQRLVNGKQGLQELQILQRLRPRTSLDGAVQQSKRVAIQA